ncbi:NFU domain protein 4 isoform 2 [Hibiscus syriacus]|uniref:NFU domain protein 4 isoform 2 n=1 Tax=Hibiscus syriacus TaxID=106335 RepID=A0A6A2WFN9_HIBSY|nr:NFU domain protein 4 isoform 2 [Hibiscus syriacus]
MTNDLPEGIPHGDEEIWFHFPPAYTRFGREEFCLVTDLPFGRYDELGALRDEVGALCDEVGALRDDNGALRDDNGALRDENEVRILRKEDQRDASYALGNGKVIFYPEWWEDDKLFIPVMQRRHWFLVELQLPSLKTVVYDSRLNYITLSALKDIICRGWIDLLPKYLDVIAYWTNSGNEKPNKLNVTMMRDEIAPQQASIARGDCGPFCALDGGIDIPHSEKRFIGFNKDRQKRSIFIQTQSTPNPSSLMFYPGKAVMEVGSTDFPNARSAMNSPLAKALHGIDGQPLFLDSETAEAKDTAIHETLMEDMVGSSSLFSLSPVLDTGIVKLKMQGACSGCPSSFVTLKSGTENMLTRYVPEHTGSRKPKG